MMAEIQQGALGADRFIDVVASQGDDHTIRYCSGQMVYIESFVDGRWLGRYWSADGRINLPYELWADGAFCLRIDDQDLAAGWRFVSLEQIVSGHNGTRDVVVTLAHTRQPVSLKILTRLDGTAVLVRWLEITNCGNQPIALERVSPWAGRLWLGRNFTLGYFTQDIWACEGWYQWEPLPVGITALRCDKGQGHDDPFFIIRNEVAGEYFIGHLAWSANWQISFQRDEQGLCFAAGPEAVAVQRVLAAGETITTPAVHLGHTSGSLDRVVQAMHEHLRCSVLPARPAGRTGLVQYLVPADQGYYKPFDEQSTLQCVDVAAAIGAELFLLDAYWWDVTPNWVPSADRFPRGLEAVIDYVHKKGMLFGLYVEPEAGRGRVSESRVYAEHSEWFGPKKVLDLTNSAAATWMEAEMCRLIEQYRLDLYRLDYNPGFTYEGPTSLHDGFVENNYWRYYEAFYGIHERLRSKYPHLILQQCAAGGARNDLGTAGRFHESYLTDGLSLPRELQVYSGLTLGLPPEVFVILHGADGGVGIGKPQNLDTILRVTYALATPQVFVGSVAPSVAELSPQRLARFRHYDRIYKHFIRPLLPTCRVYHHAPVNWRDGVESGPWFAMEYAAPDRSRGWALVVRLRQGVGDAYIYRYPNEVSGDGCGGAGRYDEDMFKFTPRGLDPGRTYSVVFDALDSRVQMSGLCLQQEGLQIRLENVGMSELLLFEAD